MQINIQYTRPEDLETIFSLYDDAIAYQKSVGNNHWFGFEQELILQEIAEGRHYTVFAENIIVATFCITLGDPHIWKDSNNKRAVYIHRIATSKNFRGNSVLTHIIDWAKVFAKENELTYIRMDTGAGNERLINYYIGKGFAFVGNTTIDYSPGMPAHYKDSLFALLEMAV